MDNWIICKIFLILLLYVLWLECSPGLGHIWLRPDENGIMRVRPMNILNFMFGSIFNKNGWIFWNLEMLDVNFIVFFAVLWYVLEIIPSLSSVWKYFLEATEESEFDKKNK